MAVSVRLGHEEGEQPVQVFQMAYDQADGDGALRSIGFRDSLSPLRPGLLVKEVAFRNPDVEHPPGGGQFQGAVRRQRCMAEDIRHFLPVNGRNDEGVQAGDVEGGLAPFPAGLESGKTQGRHHVPGIVGRMGLVMEEAQEMRFRMSV